MLTKKQVSILSVFKENLSESLTFKQIKQKSKQKSNSMIQGAVKEFLKQNILSVKQIGDVSVYTIMLTNTSLSYLNLMNESEIEKSKIPMPILEEIKSRLLKQTPFFILAIFGSYAKGKTTEKSDLDVAIIVDSKQAKKDCTPLLETIRRREIIPIDYHVFLRNEFGEMLKTEEENVGKQIAKNSIIYYGYIPYCYLTKGGNNE